MKKVLRKLAVRVKLLSSFLLLALLILVMGVTGILIQQSLKRNQEETLASVRLSDAFFEGKYFLRADMHIYTELVKTIHMDKFDYWWGEHEFQSLFFNDQLTKVESEFINTKAFDSDTLEKQIVLITKEISQKYDNELLPVFSEIRNLKVQEIRLHNSYNSIVSDSSLRAEIADQLISFSNKYQTLNSKVTQYGLEIITLLDTGKDAVRIVVDDIEESGEILSKRSFNIFLIFTIGGIIFSLFVAFYISKLITRPVNKILKHVDLLGKGEHPDTLNIALEDEFGAIQHSLNKLTGSLVSTSSFAKEIGDGNFDSNFKPMSDDDILGNALIHMRTSLNNARTEEQNRRIDDERRTWAATGIGKFAELMRQSNKDIVTLSYELISNLTDYVGASQGALYMINDDDGNDIYYESIAAVAYNRGKNIDQKIRIGEGLVGRVVFEEETIYLKEVPNNYVNITSGLGDANPNVLLLVPIKLEEVVNGAIELVSFKEFEPYQIEFIEKVGESIASFISSSKTNDKTSALLKDSQIKSEELAAQEEEMRQNMEELQATQEEAARREDERIQLWDSMGQFVGILEADINGSISNANAMIGSLLNKTLTELNNTNYKTLFFENEQQTGSELWSSAISGVAVQKEMTWDSAGTKKKLLHELTLVKTDGETSDKVLILIREIV